MQMFKKGISATFHRFDEIAQSDQYLLEEAAKVRINAYAPYSDYFVGAAIRFTDGVVTLGCNHEVCTYTQTTHAEQAALVARTGLRGAGTIAVVAIVAGPSEVTIDLSEVPEITLQKSAFSEKDVIVPCGECLQMFWEKCAGNQHVVLLGYNWRRKLVTKTSMGDAFPFCFGPDDLEQ